MAAAQRAEDHGDEQGLAWYLRWGIYASIITWTHWHNSLAAEALNLKISYHGTSLNWLQRPSQSASHFEFDGKSMETETTVPECPNGGKAIAEQILVSEEINKSKRAGLRITVRDPSRKVNFLSKVIWKMIIKYTRSISSTRIG